MHTTRKRRLNKKFHHPLTKSWHSEIRKNKTWTYLFRMHESCHTLTKPPNLTILPGFRGPKWWKTVGRPYHLSSRPTIGSVWPPTNPHIRPQNHWHNWIFSCAMLNLQKETWIDMKILRKFTHVRLRLCSSHAVREQNCVYANATQKASMDLYRCVRFDYWDILFSFMSNIVIEKFKIWKKFQFTYPIDYPLHS